MQSTDKSEAECASLRRRSNSSLDDWTHFDCAFARRRNSRRDRERLIEVLCLDQKVAAKLFVGLRKRAVSNQFLAVANAYAARHRNRMQLRPAKELTTRRKFLPQLAVFRVHLLHLSLCVRCPLLLILVNQQQVF